MAFIRRLFIPFAAYKPYGNGDITHGWAGWYEIAGVCIGFKDTDGRIVTRY